jgi:hypothetical protein
MSTPIATPKEPGHALALAPRTPPAVVHRAASVSGWRFLRAYTTTFLVIASYLWLGFRARLFGRAWRDANIGDVHRRNSRRVYATILRLQGLFIKVGQLLSIMANFLPAEFRAELEGLQDQVPPRPFAEIEERLKRELGSGRCRASPLSMPSPWRALPSARCTRRGWSMDGAWP